MKFSQSTIAVFVAATSSALLATGASAEPLILMLDSFPTITHVVQQQPDLGERPPISIQPWPMHGDEVGTRLMINATVKGTFDDKSGILSGSGSGQLSGQAIGLCTSVHKEVTVEYIPLPPDTDIDSPRPPPPQPEDLEDLDVDLDIDTIGGKIEEEPVNAETIPRIDTTPPPPPVEEEGDETTGHDGGGT